MDEISLGAATYVGELKDGQVKEYDIHPEDFGMAMHSGRSLRVDSASDSALMMQAVLEGKAGAARDIVLLNSGAALYAADVASSMGAGIDLARQAIDSGAALAKREALVAVSQRLGQ
jgi:anthranilate phosphoribosyltransferase